MFDFGFGELLLLAIIALVVLGPERLPVAARLAGLWIRKARAQWNSVKAELENELADEELRRSLREASDVLRDSTTQLHAWRDDIASPMEQMTRISTPPPVSVAAHDPQLESAEQNMPAAPVDPAQMSLLAADLDASTITSVTLRPSSDG